MDDEMFMTIAASLGKEGVDLLYFYIIMESIQVFSLLCLIAFLWGRIIEAIKGDVKKIKEDS